MPFASSLGRNGTLAASWTSVRRHFVDLLTRDQLISLAEIADTILAAPEAD